jgi:type I restriction enzyme, R subunit
MSQHFQFLSKEWPELHEAATKAENLAHPDPRAACFYSRRTLELAINWLYSIEDNLTEPYKDDLSAKIFEPSFKNLLGNTLHRKCDLIRKLGNLAVHSNKPILVKDAIVALNELFHLCYWLGRDYGRTTKPDPTATFDPELLPKTSPVPAQSIVQIQTLSTQLADKDQKLAELSHQNASLDAQLQQLRTEIAQAKATQTPEIDLHDYTETQTRDYFIDLLLKEAGWEFLVGDMGSERRCPELVEGSRTAHIAREFPVTGMPNNSGNGFIDYVLWGNDGKPLAIIEAKRTRREPQAGQQQAKLYADCLQAQFGQRPIILYTNGYEHWLWDDTKYPPRQIQGFFKQTELELMIQRRTTRQLLLTAEINNQICGRYYQNRAIRRISETFERDHQRRALVVMATGAGKTRTVIALSDLLMRCNWVKRVLFLADRVALVKQATSAFKEYLPTANPVNLVTEKNSEGRLYLSTYPTMMGLINGDSNGTRPFGVGHFDLIVIDEAHRSVYQKYRAIFDYFDAMLVGLTATPTEEIDRNTYSLFNLETGVPTDAYTLEEAVNDGFLVPPEAVSVPLKFQREGIKYDELPEEDKEQWDQLEWEDEEIPDEVEAAALNQWLFNVDTVDKVLEHLMLRGQKVAGGDRLGKTIIFAKNNDHAKFIAERFDANYPHYQGEFARVITHKVEYAQSLIEDFSIANKPPHIAISVDMLDTGIDVPEVVNLVFFKIVRSKTKFWQMVGRGTRLCPNLFETDRHKEFFYIFDYCQNLEFFSQNVKASSGAVSVSLGKRLFCSRLELLAELDKLPQTTQPPGSAPFDKLRASPLTGRDSIGSATLTGQDSVGERNRTESEQVSDTSGFYDYAVSKIVSETDVRQSIASQLHQEVVAMNLDNFIVRPQRQLVETYNKATAWQNLQPAQLNELAEQIAGLPTQLPTEPETAKRFDLLMLRLQLARLKQETRFARLVIQVREIAAALETKDSIPQVQEQMELIQELQTDEWWIDVTIPLLERARIGLRTLIGLIDKTQRQPIYTNFIDEMGTETVFELPGFISPNEFDRFRAKARQFLIAHENHITIHKLRFNQPLTATDLNELERMLLTAEIGTREHLNHAKETCAGLGIFIRSLVGLDREAAKKAFGNFISGSPLSASQIEFINLIIDHLTYHGIMQPSLLYESPFTDINAQGPEGVFSSEQVDDLVAILDRIHANSAA